MKWDAQIGVRLRVHVRVDAASEDEAEELANDFVTLLLPKEAEELDRMTHKLRRVPAEPIR